VKEGGNTKVSSRDEGSSLRSCYSTRYAPQLYSALSIDRVHTLSMLAYSTMMYYLGSRICMWMGLGVWNICIVMGAEWRMITPEWNRMTYTTRVEAFISHCDLDHSHPPYISLQQHLSPWSAQSLSTMARRSHRSHGGTVQEG
jgi:hypothetical protein